MRHFIRTIPPYYVKPNGHASADPIFRICRSINVLDSVELWLRGIDFILIEALASVIREIQTLNSLLFDWYKRVRLTQKTASIRTQREFINKFRVFQSCFNNQFHFSCNWVNCFQRHANSLVTELLLISADVMLNQRYRRSHARQDCKWGENQPADQFYLS